MSDTSPSLRSLILGPGLCLAVIVAMSLENRQYHDEADIEPFHVKAALAVERIPLVIAPWMGQEIPLTEDERRILSPNAYRCIKFVDTRAAALDDPSRQVLLMVAQCRRAGQMNGHYPPECYPSRGYMPVGSDQRRSWVVNGTVIDGMEYAYERREAGRAVRTSVYNFMVLPNQGIRADMKAINESAEDYQQRYYGAAQFQVVFAGALAEAGSRGERDKIFAELMNPCLGVIQTLSEGAIEHE
ncbi:MAG TPA: hypothetical protein VGB55_06600 [Tepidisphaeraceae bacterium]|jgi:hypothetical protein